MHCRIQAELKKSDETILSVSYGDSSPSPKGVFLRLLTVSEVEYIIACVFLVCGGSLKDSSTALGMTAASRRR